jgi:Alternative complex III, ActD subunit
MSNTTLQAIFDDDDVLLGAVKDLKAANYHIEEVFTPFPVHGLEKAVGLPDTRIAIMSFIYGIIGLAFSIWMMDYMMITDWPQNIGGKPSGSFAENSPAFVPIMFELTVFFAAHLMVITFYMRSKLWPFKEAENPDVRTTDDHFMIEVATDDDVKALEKLLKKSGAKEIKTKA